MPDVTVIEITADGSVSTVLLDPSGAMIYATRAEEALATIEEALATIEDGYAEVFPVTSQSVGMWAFQLALVDEGTFETVRDALPEDVSDAGYPATIAFRTGAPVTPGDVFHSWAQSVLTKSDEQMAALMATARAKTL